MGGQQWNDAYGSHLHSVIHIRHGVLRRIRRARVAFAQASGAAFDVFAVCRQVVRHHFWASPPGVLSLLAGGLRSRWLPQEA